MREVKHGRRTRPLASDGRDGALALHFAYYNFCRIRKTIRCTPAMEAGITQSVWELKDLDCFVVRSPVGIARMFIRIAAPLLGRVAISSVGRVASMGFQRLARTGLAKGVGKFFSRAAEVGRKPIGELFGRRASGAAERAGLRQAERIAARQAEGAAADAAVDGGESLISREALSKGVSGDNAGIMLREGFEQERVFFGQARVDPAFSAKPGVPDYLKNKTLDEIAAKLRAGEMSSDDILIHAYRYEGKLVLENTRGLTVLSMADMKPTNIQMIQPSRNVLNRLKETSVLGDALPSTRIAITPSRLDRTILRIVRLR